MTTELEIKFEITKYINCKDTLFDVKSGFHLFLIYKYIKRNTIYEFLDDFIDDYKNGWDYFTNSEKSRWNSSSNSLKNNTNINYIHILSTGNQIISKIEEERKYNSYEGILSRKLGRVNNLIDRINNMNNYDVFSDDEYEHREWEIEDLHRQLSEAKNDLYSFYSS